MPAETTAPTADPFADVPREPGAPKPDPIVVAHGIKRQFGGLTAVNKVSFIVKSGEIFGVIGPNGAGKTTLFNLMTGLTPPSSGTLTSSTSDRCASCRTAMTTAPTPLARRRQSASRDTESRRTKPPL